MAARKATAPKTAKVSQSKATPVQAGLLSDFSGGLNLRDSPPELAANELEDAWNITLDERGGVASRKGYESWATFSGPIVNLFWSNIAGALVTQAGNTLKLGSSNTTNHTFTTADAADFCETKDSIIAAHPVDGIWASPDGVTWTQITGANVPTNPTCCAAWQSKLWVGDATGRVTWSAAGDPTTWNVDDWIDIWDKDQTGIVALAISSGQDIQGRPGLLAFKQESVYRINDPATGSYTTIDSLAGAASHKAVIAIGPKICWIGRRGVYWWQETGSLSDSATNASDLLRPLWQPSQLNLSEVSQWCAGRRLDRAWFSLTRANALSNDLALEFHPTEGWVMPRSDAFTAYATSTDTGEEMFGGGASGDDSVYELDTGGTDNGTAISWRAQTRWLELNSGFQASVWQLRLHGRGEGTLTVLTDYALQGSDRSFDLDVATQDWDSGLFWDSGLTWSVPTYQSTEAFYSLGVARQASLVFSGTSSDVANAPQVFQEGTPPTVGAFGLTSLEYLFIDLGLS